MVNEVCAEWKSEKHLLFFQDSKFLFFFSQCDLQNIAPDLMLNPDRTAKEQNMLLDGLA